MDNDKNLCLMLKKFLKALVRRKAPESKDTELDRCLSLLDLTSLGIGGTLGLGLYVLAGSVAKTYAGPAVCISFLLAAVASSVAAICYAEFASRVPRAGSSYVYSYVSVGELPAFAIGWNLLVGCTISCAGTASGLTSYIDALTGNQIRDTLNEWMPMKVSFLADYPDIFSCALILCLTAVLAAGVKQSSLLNKIFTVWNMAVVGILLICGSIKANASNWSIPKDVVPNGYGNGGFMPYGISGIITGASKCFYGYVGFDVVATAGEEAKNPQRNVPLGIILVSAIGFAIYFGISTVITMMVPYYDQDADAPFPYAFNQVQWYDIKWLVTTGAICALCNSMFAGLFSLPRISYSMASDGLIYKFFAKVNPKTQTPLVATLILGFLSAFMATFFKLDQLLDMTSISAFITYSIICISVVILRYKPIGKSTAVVDKFSLRTLINLNNNVQPNSLTTKIANWTIAIFYIFAAIICAMLINLLDAIQNQAHISVLFTIACVCAIICMVIIYRQPSENVELSFKVPWVPFVPCLSVFFNLYLMLQLDVNAWVPFIVTQIIGFLIYFSYGIRHSEEAQKDALFRFRN